MTSRGTEKMKNDTIGVDVSKTIVTLTGWPTAPPGVSPTIREATKRSSNGSRRRL
jgi:hypothetical protein